MAQLLHWPGWASQAGLPSHFGGSNQAFSLPGLFAAFSVCSMDINAPISQESNALEIRHGMIFSNWETWWTLSVFSREEKNYFVIKMDSRPLKTKQSLIDTSLPPWKVYICAAYLNQSIEDIKMFWRCSEGAVMASVFILTYKDCRSQDNWVVILNSALADLNIV